MKRIITYIATIIACLVIGFIIGSFIAGAKATAMSNSASLVWLTGIRNQIESGNSEKTLKLLDTAIDAHISIYREASKYSHMCFIYSSPWAYNSMTLLQQNLMRNSKRGLLSSKDDLNPESEAYLESIPDTPK